jgi:hypothetical protein
VCPKFLNAKTVTDPIDNQIIVTDPITEKLTAVTPAKTSTRASIGEKIRSELNIEKWPAIWRPAKSKNKPALRIMERESTTTEGMRMVSRVEVGYTHLGTLSTEEQKMLYVLVKLWEDSGKPDTQVFFSSRALARMLRKKGWGTNVIDSITKSLRKLRSIPIEWVNSYYDQTKKGGVVVDRRPLTLLGDLRVTERRQDGAVNSSQGYFKFNDHILTNLQLNYTKPVCIEEFFKLRSEIAQLIYSHIDLILFDKSKYERKTRALFDDLGLKNAEYLHMYERKRAIEKALKELQGIRLSNGVLKSATIEKTVDGKDYKVSFSKSASTARLDVPVTLPEELPPGVVINDYSKTKNSIVDPAEELVGTFYKLFHGVEKHYVQSKETDQALSLITRHGLDRAKHIVNFSKYVAGDTNYLPQTFGGIMHYASRALADFDQKAKAIPPRPVAAAVPETAAPKLERGERRLAALTPEQFAVRLAEAKEVVLVRHPTMARMAARYENGIIEKMIRTQMVRQLEEEPMDLMLLSNLTDWANHPRKICPYKPRKNRRRSLTRVAHQRL